MGRLRAELVEGASAMSMVNAPAATTIFFTVLPRVFRIIHSLLWGGACKYSEPDPRLG
jgi:hypothetical protein